MPFTWIILLTFISTSLLMLFLARSIYECVFRYKMTVRERLVELSKRSSTEGTVTLFKEFRQLQEMENKPSWQDRIRGVIEQSGGSMSIWNLCCWAAGSALLLGCFGFFYAWWMGMAFSLAGFCAPFALLYWRRHVRRRKLCRQLPEAFAMISRAVRAGQTIPAAMQIIADDFEPPISTEFALCYEQQNLGISRETALRKLAVRSGIMDLQLFVVALLVQGRSGGDLVEILDNLALMIRKRLKLKDRVQALTGEGRLQALVLILLPMAALVGLMILAPEYAQELLDRPQLLALTGAAQLVGALWIRKIVNFAY